jgi:predicted metal-dependent peptidase
MNELLKLNKARVQMVLDHPFFASLALRLKLIEDRSIETAFTDGVVIGFNPQFIGRLSVEETKWLVAHEVMHLACIHHTRRGKRDPGKWNIACDHAINGILNEAGFKTPAGVFLDYRYSGLSAEAVYDRLPEESEGEDKAPPGPGQVRDAPVDIKQAQAQWQVNLAQAAQQAKAAGSLPESLARLVEKVLHPKVDWRVLLRHFVEQAAKNDYCWLPPSRR